MGGHLSMTRYGEIDVTVQYRAVKVLQGQDSPTRASLIRQIQQNPQNYTPAVLFVLSSRLYESGRRGEAMYWYYAAQLRTRYDVNRCRDESVRATLTALNNAYGAQIEAYAQQNIPTFRQMVAAAIHFENNTPHGYDHRWINLHGMRAARAMRAALMGMSVNEAEPMSYPEEEWEAIHRRTIEDYKDDMEHLARKWNAAP